MSFIEKCRDAVKISEETERDLTKRIRTLGNKTVGGKIKSLESEIEDMEWDLDQLRDQLVELEDAAEAGDTADTDELETERHALIEERKRLKRYIHEHDTYGEAYAV